MAEKKTISAKAVVVDIKAGMSDEQLMAKYGLTAKGLGSVLNKLINAGLLRREEIGRHTSGPSLQSPAATSRESLRVPPSKGEASFLSERSQKLTKLKEAFDAGILTESEYENKKAKLMGQMLPAVGHEQLPKVSPHQSTPDSMIPTGQTKFTLQIGETLIKEGYSTYLKSTFNAVQGDAYLTSQRFVYCKKSAFLFYFLLGPLLGHLVKGKQVVFEIPLTQFFAISKQKHGLGKKMVLETRDGQCYGVGFINDDAWVKSIGETVINFVPGTVVKQGSERIDFVANSEGQPVQSVMSSDAVMTAKPKPSPSSQVPVEPAIVDIDPYYMNIFKQIEQGRLRHINGYALLTGAFWYLYKRMWPKGLVYLAAAVVFAEIFSGIGALPVWIAVSFTANWDYYLHRVHGETFFTKHWLAGQFPDDLPKRIIEE